MKLRLRRVWWSELKLGGLILLSILLVASVVTQTVPSCVTPPSGMVSWWPGEGDANDIQGGNDGTLENGPALPRAK
jgi:hypothetical protein